MPVFTRVKLFCLVVFPALLLTSCGGHVYHIVEPGETLYSISWIYDQNYKDIAYWNGVDESYTIKPGQRLRVAAYGPGEQRPTKLTPQVVNKPSPQPISKPAVLTKAKPYAATAPAVKPQQDRIPTTVGPDLVESEIQWRWPTKGGVVNEFSISKLNKGIDIEGKQGQPVYSAASGKVVYAGSGLVGYGKMIIINHNQTFLSAYGHNNEILVSEGSQVKRGDLIARMGSTGTNGTKLHFEIRRDGKPVNPLDYLPKTQ